jgi:hypothetical protein
MNTATTTFRRSLTAGRIVPISRGLDLYLRVQSGSGEHLADCFRSVFEKLPRPVANLLLDHWQGGPSYLALRPTLELLAALRPGIELQQGAPGLVYGVTDERQRREARRRQGW